MNLYLLNHEYTGQALFTANVFQVLFALLILVAGVRFLWVDFEPRIDETDATAFSVLIIVGLCLAGFLHPEATRTFGILLFSGLGLIGIFRLLRALRRRAQRVKRRWRDIRCEIRRIQNEQELLAKRTNNANIPGAEQFNWRWKLQFLLGRTAD